MFQLPTIMSTTCFKISFTDLIYHILLDLIFNIDELASSLYRQSQHRCINNWLGMLSLHLCNTTFEGAEGIKPIEICRQYYKIKIAQELILQQQLQNVWNMIKLQHIEITLLYSPHLLTNSHTRAHDLSKVAVGLDLG